MTTVVLSAVAVVFGGNSYGLECEDKTVCLTRQTCSNNDALYRSGHLCRGFPYYNGGAPVIEKLEWDSEDEEYTCRRAVGHTCVDWATRENSAGEYEVGYGYCMTLNDTTGSTRLGLDWRVEQSEVDYCCNECWESGSLMRLVDGSSARTQCCKRVCNDDGCYNKCSRREIEGETANCHCTKVLAANGGHYCDEWHCVEQDNNGIHHAEYENYRCLELHPTQPLCIAWSGNIDGYEEFELSDCWCKLGRANGSDYCETWRCREDGLNKEYPDLDWIAFGVLLGTFMALCGIALVFCADFETCGTIVGFVIVAVVLAGAVVLPALIRGGFVVFLVTFLYNTLLMAGGVFLYLRKKRPSNEPTVKVVSV